MSRSNFGGSGARDSRKHHRKPIKAQSGRVAKIESAEELDIYLSGDYIECLLCGRNFKSLGMHLKKTHGYEPRKYKEDFNIPVTRSLSGERTRKLSSDAMLNQWVINPKYAAVRKNIIRNPPVNTSPSKSTLSESLRVSASKKALIKENKQQADLFAKSRLDCMAAMKRAIKEGITLRATGIIPARVRRYARSHPNDAEFLSLLAEVKKPRSNIKGVKGSNKNIDLIGSANDNQTKNLY